jgi:hypothetical protein
MSKKRLWLLPVLLVLYGCAGVSVARLDSDSSYRGGVRFYRPQPYLLVTDAKGALETSIVYLPKVNAIAGELYGTGKAEQNAVKDAWKSVGVA